MKNQVFKTLVTSIGLIAFCSLGCSKTSSVDGPVNKPLNVNGPGVDRCWPMPYQGQMFKPMVDSLSAYTVRFMNSKVIEVCDLHRIFVTKYNAEVYESLTGLLDKYEEEALMSSDYYIAFKLSLLSLVISPNFVFEVKRRKKLKYLLKNIKISDSVLENDPVIVFSRREAKRPVSLQLFNPDSERERSILVKAILAKFDRSSNDPGSK